MRRTMTCAAATALAALIVVSPTWTRTDVLTAADPPRRQAAPQRTSDVSQPAPAAVLLPIQITDLQSDQPVAAASPASDLVKLHRGVQKSKRAKTADRSEADEQLTVAVQYAVRQTGRRYVWGADGRGGFDCSGLTRAAYRQAGVILPHSSRAQSGQGQRVASVKDLQPGDLLFWYSPVHHVGMYIGGGKFVHARNRRVGVVVQTLDSYPAPLTAIRRITD